MTPAPSQSSERIVATTQPHASLALLPREWAALLILAGLCGVAAFRLGQSSGWDLRNYHVYVAWAWWEGRAGVDIAAAQMQTWFNPLPYVPIYWAMVHLPTWLTTALLGVVQGLAVIPLYLVARAVLTTLPASIWRISAFGCAFAGIAAATVVSGLGTSYVDGTLALLPLAGLALLVALPRPGIIAVASAGLLVGAGVGLKLTLAPCALGLLVALLALPAGRGNRATQAAAFCAAALVGVAITGGGVFWQNAQVYGNPIYPQFSSWFPGEWAPPHELRQVQYLPRGLREHLVYPLIWTADWRRVGELPFRDLRWPLFGVLFLLAIASSRGRARLGDPALRAVVLCALATYAGWLLLFGYHRYLVFAEMLAPALCVALLHPWLAPGTPTRIGLALMLATLVLSTRAANHGRLPGYGSAYIEAMLPERARAPGLAVLIGGDSPLAYLAPSFRLGTRFFRVSSNFHGGRWPPFGLDLAIARAVDAHQGPLLLLVEDHGREQIDLALARFGLRTDWDDCDAVQGNYVVAADHPPVFCALQRERTALEGLRIQVDEWSSRCANTVDTPVVELRACTGIALLRERLPQAP